MVRLNAPDVYTTFVYTTAGQLAILSKLLILGPIRLPRSRGWGAPDRPGFGAAKLLIISNCPGQVVRAGQSKVNNTLPYGS